jgi:futalosine hydrolase
MHILLCAATRFEIEPLIQMISNRHFNHEIQVAVTGIGSVATVYSLMKVIGQNKPGLMIQAGIAGSFNPDLPLEKIVAIDRDSIADLGVTEKGKFHSVFSMGLENPNEFPWENGWLVNDHEILKSTNLEKHSAVTVNEITTSPHSIEYYRSLGAVTESMEGAALHYVGLRENIPFLQVRAISNYIGERDKSQWRIHESIDKLNHEVSRIIKEL